jgi:homoprotocatechuate degradation regulator HpaR
MAPRPKRASAGDPLKIPAGRKMRRFEHSLPMALLRAREAVMAYFRPLHRERGVTEQQWRVIRALREGPPIDITTLAERTFLLMPSLSRILRQLARRGLVARQTQSADHRRAMISLTRAGRAMIDKGSRRSEDRYADITRRFGAPRLRTLYALLAELETALQRPRSPRKRT